MSWNHNDGCNISPFQFSVRSLISRSLTTGGVNANYPRVRLCVTLYRFPTCMPFNPPHVCAHERIFRLDLKSVCVFSGSCHLQIPLSPSISSVTVPWTRPLSVRSPAHVIAKNYEHSKSLCRCRCMAPNRNHGVRALISTDGDPCDGRVAVRGMGAGGIRDRSVRRI